MTAQKHTLPALHEGDIYRWRWSDPAKDNDCGPYGSYHCYSRMAVVRDGLLTDTYWHGPDSKVLDPATVILTPLGNISDLQEIRSCNVGYYRREDIVDMRHSNNAHGPIYLRKGAERDAGTMMELIERRIEDLESEIQFATYRVDRLRKDAELVRQGRLGEVFL